MDLTDVFIRQRLRETFSQIDGSGFSSDGTVQPFIQLNDNDYQTVNPNDLSAIVANDPLLTRAPYRDNAFDAFDCDDAALLVKASLTRATAQQLVASGGYVAPPAVGIVVTNGHVLNVVLADVGDEAQVGLFDATLARKEVLFDKEAMLELLVSLPIQMIYI